MRNLQLKARLRFLAELIKNILLIILANKEIKMVKRKHPCIYKEKNRNTYFVKKIMLTLSEKAKYSLSVALTVLKKLKCI